MDPADGNHTAELAALVHTTQQQLLACSRLCERLARVSERPSIARTTRRAASTNSRASTQPISPAESAERARALATQLDQLVTTLTRQADALRELASPPLPDRMPDSPGRRRWLAVEAERARLARDLHDGPAQRFANAVVETEYLERLSVRDPAAVAEALVRLRASLQQGVVEIRQSLFELRVPGVEEQGLTALIRDYLPEYERQFGVVVDAALSDTEVPVSSEQAVAILRVLQEGLTNARKHSGSRHARVELQRDENELVLTVEDRGRGFTPEQARSGQYGLLGMQEHALLAGGRLDVDGRPGEGTRVVLRVPLW
jgi:two-component system sensor histidine kinase DegS